jgi:sugar phosphate permease
MKTVSIISLSVMAYILGRSFINEYNYTTACLLSIVNLVILLGYIYITDKHKNEKIDIKAIIAGIFYTLSLILYLESMNDNNTLLSIKNQNILLFIFGLVLILIMLGHNITKGEAFGAFITILGLITIIKYSN